MQFTLAKSSGEPNFAGNEEKTETEKKREEAAGHS